MTKTITQEEQQLFDELRRGGIPLDEEVLQGMTAASCGLSLEQTGTVVDTSIFDLDSGGTGYALSIAICNDSDRTIRPIDFRLEMPWWEPRLLWLQDPSRQVPKRATYDFPGSTFVGIEREAVLNHQLHGKTKLYPGDFLEGLLLGVGERTIPDAYQDRQPLVVPLTLIDGRGKHCELEVKFMLQLQGRTRLRSAKPSPRRFRKLIDWESSGGLESRGVGGMN